MHVWDLGGNGVHPGRERPRQTQHGALPVKFRKGIASADDFSHSAAERNQPVQAGLDFQHNISSARFDERGIAHKLQRISQALLAVQQDSRTFQRFTLPERLRKSSAMAKKVGSVPAVFMFVPAQREVSLQQMNMRS